MSSSWQGPPHGPESQGPPPHEEFTTPPYQAGTWGVIGGALLVVLVLFNVRAPLGPDAPRDYPSRVLHADAEPVLIASEMDDEYWPCSDCHEGEPTNYDVREFEDDHEDLELRHGDLWCMHCHDAEDRDMLKLANGELVKFEESWRLCTQCHAKKLADWRAGVHGKRTGQWWGRKEYRTCVVCHNPHAPPFESLEPRPPPWRPEQIALNGGSPREGATHE